jgi:hypothetical protein
MVVGALSTVPILLAINGILVTSPAAAPRLPFSVAGCLNVAMGRGAADPSCPRFLVDAYESALAACRDSGGRLVSTPDATVWPLDVNGDDKPEYLFEIGRTVTCEGAPSLLGCGSSDCPLRLYEQRGTHWRSIGTIGVSDPKAIEALPARSGSQYRELRVGCPGEAPCEEFAYYRHGKDGYELARLQVRGHWVDVSAQRGELRGLAREIVVKATPTKDAVELQKYAAGTEVVVLGRASGTPYVYVSPCNACANGFVEASALKPEEPAQQR